MLPLLRETPPDKTSEVKQLVAVQQVEAGLPINALMMKEDIYKLLRGGGRSEQEKSRRVRPHAKVTNDKTTASGGSGPDPQEYYVGSRMALAVMGYAVFRCLMLPDGLGSRHGVRVGSTSSDV